MSLSKLESKKVILDFKHTKEELLLKKEIISEIDPLFNQAINDYLSSDDALKAEWTSRFEMPNVAEPANEKQEMVKYTGEVDTEQPTPDPEPEAEPEPVEAEQVEEDSDPEKNDPFGSVYKMVYREIVKKTHPDKVSHLPEEERLERCKIYMDATLAYEKKDIGELIYYAHMVKVSFDMGKNEITFLKGSVEKYKKESTFLEQTYSWKWFYADDEAKQSLVQRFVTQILGEK
jgi:hypothetical protein